MSVNTALDNLQLLLQMVNSLRIDVMEDQGVTEDEMLELEELVTMTIKELEK